MKVTSGYRPGRYNTAAGGAKKSNDTICLACDFADADGALAAYCLANLDVLEKSNLYMEDPAHTKGWCICRRCRRRLGSECLNHENRQISTCIKERVSGSL